MQEKPNTTKSASSKVFFLMLEILNINKSFVHHIALSQVNLRIEQGEFFSLLGPSGCGKTTLLRILAGFETPDSGEILLDQVPVTNIPPQKRPFNMVFQKYALFPHLSVDQNLAFGLRMKKVSSDDIKRRVENILRLVNLQEFSARFPDTLSGGQAQRVALGRALINEPRVLLLDEPLSALDMKMREHVQNELRSLQRKLGLTFVFVTHDQEEAFALSDRIAVMNAGRIEQVSSPQELYERPESSFVAEFIGQMNKISGRVKEVAENEVLVEFAGHQLRSSRQRQKNLQVGDCGLIYLRPEDLSINPEPTDNQSLKGRLIRKIFRGDHFDYEIELAPGLEMYVQVLTGEARHNLGDPVSLHFKAEDVFVFKAGKT